MDEAAAVDAVTDQAPEDAVEGEGPGSAEAMSALESLPSSPNSRCTVTN